MQARPINTKAATIGLSIVALWGWFAWQSGSQPFIPSEAYLNLLMYGVLPLLTAASLYFIFCFKHASTGMTGWQVKVQSYSTSDRTKTALQVILLTPIF
jgi:hypothetical protein